MKCLRLLPILLLLFVIHACRQSSENTETSSLGNIDFKVTASPEAAESFQQGVLLLHSFMYSDAAVKFRKAQEIDPDFGMAYWGESMTYNHPLWSEQNYEKATAVLNRFGAGEAERLAKIPTEFEKDLFKSVEILYGEGTKFERDDAYAAYLADLNKKYPENHEVSAFYALSLLGSVESGRDYEVYEKGAKIAKGILEENPRHPGALHYLIHSYDDPDHAPLALEAADSYSQVAPDAGHALHMPSHIYIAMGMWDEVITSNIRSYEAKLKRVEKNSSLGWNLHAYHWLLYGYLQKNDLKNAEEIMNKMVTYAEDRGGSNYTKSYVIDMVGNFWAETNDWNAAAPSLEFDTDGMNVRFEASKLFLEGYRALQNSDYGTAASKLVLIEESIKKARNQFTTRGITVCSGVGFASRAPNEDDIATAEVLAIQLKASLALFKEQQDDEVETLLAKAVQMEDDISFAFGPPAIVVPTYEMYGNWLLKKERYSEAIEQFNRSLEKGPGRMKALRGKLEAARGLGDQSIIDEVQKQLTENSASATNS